MRKIKITITKIKSEKMFSIYSLISYYYDKKYYYIIIKNFNCCKNTLLYKELIIGKLEIKFLSSNVKKIKRN